jgi:hemerythrin superfamily protein
MNRTLISLVKPKSLLTARQFSTSIFKMSLVSDVIKHDHRELEAYYDRIINSSNEDEQTRYQNLFAWELARHSIGEELVVYPQLEKRVTGGHDLAERDRAEHQKVCILSV